MTNSISKAIRIASFRPQDQDEVRELILAGLRDHWGTVDPDKNPDLADIATTYAGGTFLVAWLGERVVGTGALVPLSAEAAEIKRMSVARDLRRQGVGRLILEQLIDRARTRSFSRIVLETTQTWQDATSFYLRHGFRLTHHAGGDAYFAMELSAAEEDRRADGQRFTTADGS